MNFTSHLIALDDNWSALKDDGQFIFAILAYVKNDTTSKDGNVAAPLVAMTLISSHFR